MKVEGPSQGTGAPRRILHLTLHRRWFDEIASGRKKEEYREKKTFWERRLFSASGFPILYDEIHFRNGYAKSAPWMRVKYRGLKDGVFQGKDVYAIQLGDILEIRNYEAPKARRAPEPQAKGSPAELQAPTAAPEGK